MKIVFITIFAILLSSILLYLMMYRIEDSDPEKAAQENYRKRIIDRYKYQ